MTLRYDTPKAPMRKRLDTKHLTGDWIPPLPAAIQACGVLDEQVESNSTVERYKQVLDRQRQRHKAWWLEVIRLRAEIAHAQKVIAAFERAETDRRLTRWCIFLFIAVCIFSLGTAVCDLNPVQCSERAITWLRIQSQEPH